MATQQIAENKGVGSSCSLESSCQQRVNVGSTERMVSALGGGAMALFGISRGGLPGLLAAGLGAGLIYRGVSGHCSVYQAMGVQSTSSSRPGVRSGQGIQYERTLTVNRPVRDLYQFWQQPENLARVFRHVKSVVPDGENRLSWIAVGPLGQEWKWESEIFNKRELKLIAWQSLPGGDVEAAGSLHFDSIGEGRGTSVRFVLQYRLPQGQVAERVASYFGQGLDDQITEDLRRFKSIAEAGEIPSVEGQPRG